MICPQRLHKFLDDVLEPPGVMGAVVELGPA
jgi:hypothetical protein